MPRSASPAMSTRATGTAVFVVQLSWITWKSIPCGSASSSVLARAIRNRSPGTCAADGHLRQGSADQSYSPISNSIVVIAFTCSVSQLVPQANRLLFYAGFKLAGGRVVKLALHAH